MKKSDLKEKSSVFYLGRGIIILALVVSTSLGFILGFFVGKNTAPPPPAADRTAVVAPTAAAIQDYAPNEPEDATSAQPKEEAISHTAQVQPLADKPEPKKEEPQGTAEISKTPRPHEAKQDKEPVQHNKNGKTTTAKDPDTSREVQHPSQKVKYTVQIGAFKNRPEADSLKAKFSKKGYKTFIEVAKPKKHEKLFKVMIGEYSSRKDAELLSVKIKRLQGLRAFVTRRAD